MAKKYTQDMFWAKIDRSGGPEKCWPWLGRKNSAGYGQIRYHGVDLTAHRLAAFFYGLLDNATGPVNRKGSGFILHQCDNPACCNPNHFKVGTARENLMEAIERGLMRYNYGTGHHMTVLSDDDVRSIRRRWPHVSQGVLAKEYGVTQACISLITRRINRADVSDRL